MTISMYQASIPVFIRHLKHLSDILQKAQDYATSKKIEPAALINFRLAPDMLPFVRQIQIVSDTVKAGASRLAGVEIPSYTDNETSFDELKERLAKTIKYLESFKAEQIDGTENKKISYHQHGRDRNFVGMQYLLDYLLPNLFFHISIAYAILRHNGLEIGKKDYLGQF